MSRPSCIIALSSLAATVAQAGGLPDAHSAASGRQLTLYISRPFGGADSRHLIYGLRLERLSDAPRPPSSPVPLGLIHHPLIDLQYSAQSQTRVQFGSRLSWSLFTHELKTDK
jgi:hypothetical protein